MLDAAAVVTTGTRRNPAAEQSSEAGQRARLELVLDGATLVVRLAGSWRVGLDLPSPEEVRRRVAADAIRTVSVDGAGVTAWDSGLLTFLIRLVRANDERQVTTDLGRLPVGVQRLLALAVAVPARKDVPRGVAAPPWLARVGVSSIQAAAGAREVFASLGEVLLAVGRLLRGRARFRRQDLLLLLQECGARALPIVSLISFLVGVILAYVGAMQLRQFGAQIYVADLVGIAMAREMGAMMTAVIMAGRTGAAFAAELGSMRVNEEIDALTTLGIPPIDFLVLPRMLALAIMMPLLCVYADLLGILGGAVVGISMLDVGAVQYYLRTVEAIHVRDALVGVVKGGVFGVLVAMAGCFRGMRCERSSAAVGLATTSAVVTAIVGIIVADALMTVFCDLLGF